MSLAKWFEKHIDMDMSTLCAGTECPITVYMAYRQAVYRTFKVLLNWNHALRSELAPAKQQFMIDMSTGTESEHTPLVADVCTLSGTEALNSITDKKFRVPSVDINFIGVPCQDVSRRNPNSRNAKNRRVVIDKGMRTGSVFEGLLNFYDVHGQTLQMGFLEEVIGLSDPPTDPPQAGDDPYYANSSNLDVMKDHELRSWLNHEALKNMVLTWLTAHLGLLSTYEQCCLLSHSCET